MSLSWKIYSLIAGVGVGVGLIVFLKFLADYQRLGKRLMVAETRIDHLERDRRKLYRKLIGVQDVKQGGVKSKFTEKARNSDNSSGSGSSFSYMSTMLSDTSTQSDSSGSGSYSSSDSGSSNSSSSYDSSSF